MEIVSKYTTALSGSVENINISEIAEPTIFVRAESNNIGELAGSIKKVGLLQPIIVRFKEGHFEIVAGNRRYRACKQLGWRKLACHVVELDDKAAFEISIVENVQRQTLGPIDEALAFKSYVKDYGWGGVSELAEKISKSPSYISRRMKLLELPEDVLDLITQSEINVSSAEELTYLKDKAGRVELAGLLFKEKMPSKRIRQIIRDKNSTFVSDFEEYPTNEFTHERICNMIDKAIIALRIAMKRFGAIMENMEENWIFYEIFMHNKNILHGQIDVLIKEKRKCKRFLRNVRAL